VGNHGINKHFEILKCHEKNLTHTAVNFVWPVHIFTDDGFL